MSRLALPLLLLAIAAAALPLTGAAAPPQDAGGVQILVDPLTDGVAMVIGQGGNIGLVHDGEQALLIDDQFGHLTEAILAAVGEHAEAPVEFVLNTHWHGDHTGGNENLGRAGALIMAHENVRERMSTDQSMPAFGREVPASPGVALPVITYERGASVYVAGQTIDLHHVPNAHTDGDSLVHMPDADVLHMGDCFFNGMYPFIDTDSGGSIDGMIAAADAALSLVGRKTRIIPGHGPLASKADLVGYLDMLSGIREAVASLLEGGADAEAVVAAKPTAPWDGDWGGGFIDPDLFAATVAGSLGAR
jgi:glyoxylase-like metal-dependent hydrolase (beta-lactamase superfamily II)